MNLCTDYYLGDQIKMNDLSWASGTNIGVERCIQGFSGKI